MLIAALYDLILDKILYSLVNSSLQSSQVNLLLTEQLKQSLLLLKPLRNHVSIAITLVHALSEQLLVLRAALGNPLKDRSSELVSLLDHLGSVRHLLLVSSFLFFLPFLVGADHFLLLLVGALATVLLWIFASDRDQTLTLEMVQEGDDA